MNDVKKHAIAMVISLGIFAGGYFAGRSSIKEEEQIKTKNKIEQIEHMTQTQIKAYETYLQQLPNWDTAKFYDWSAGYECGSKWQMAVDDLKENYLHKDSCKIIRQ